MTRNLPGTLLTTILLLWITGNHAIANDKTIVGYVEKVKVYPGKLFFHAKLDTGARNSSINAENIEEYTNNGEDWVRFDVVNRNNKRITLEMPLVREAKIKRHFGKKQHRPVVKLGICLGSTFKEVDVSLVNRQGFLYELLIGRSYLKHDFLIDPSKSYTKSPSCKKVIKKNE